MNHLTILPGHVTTLPSTGSIHSPVHEFEEEQILAINAAIAAGRPLLIRGEPGVGKSQLAQAAAIELERAFIPQVVDSHTEPRDLLWHYDALARLADAQIQGYQSRLEKTEKHSADNAKSGLAPMADYLHPRALWWAFNWTNAKNRAKKIGIKSPEHPRSWNEEHGCVVLIDEIDKAESDVPNGLLEALGANSFHPQGLDHPIKAITTPPLVIITTNEERVLPDAFIRRCFVLHLQLPLEDDELNSYLVNRGKVHFQEKTSTTVLQTAAGCLVNDRKFARKNQWAPLPGQAEYLDLLRAVIRQCPDDYAKQNKLIEKIACFVMKKHPDAYKEKMETQA